MKLTGYTKCVVKVDQSAHTG